MGRYIFRSPKIARETPLTFEGLTAYVKAGRNGYSRMLGTTVEVIDTERGGYIVWLYVTPIATVRKDGTVHISEYIDAKPHQATTWWVQKVLSDNGIPGVVGRVNDKYPQAGKTYTRAGGN